MPCTCSPLSVVITVTPVANIPSVLRSATAGSSPCRTSGASSSANSSNGLAPIPSGPGPAERELELGAGGASLTSAGASCRGRRRGSARPARGCASAARRACRPRRSVPSSAYWTAIRQRATFLRSVGERVPLVTTPMRRRPSQTSSPCPAVSLPSSSSPTSTRCGCCRALDQRLLADEVVLGVELDREADARLERVDLVVELVAGEDQPGLDADHVERLEPERLEPVRLRRPPRSRPRPPARRRGGRRPRSPARPCSRCARPRSGMPS